MLTIERWLASAGLAEYAKAFVDQRIDLAGAARLTEADLKELGMPIGDRKRFTAAFARLDQAPKLEAVEEPQRRHLTVMFCDLVDSSGLAQRHEAEDVIDVLRAYRELCGRAVLNFGGSVGQYIGDGIMAYFGHPVAHDEDAERAVRAALEICEAFHAIELPGGARPAVRIGIATGLVIVGDLVTSSGVDRRSIVGVAPNLAARLQTQAPPGGIVISDATLALVSGFFFCEDFGARALPGFAEPIRCWLVRGERTLVSRFVARQGLDALAPMVGREREVEALREAWGRALAGHGGTVLIYGEAGIGKSRLLAHFLTHVAGDDIILQHYATSPFDANSPLHCFKARLREAAKIARDDAPAARLRKLASAIVGDEEVRRRVLPIYAALLGLPNPEGRDLDLSPAQVKAATFETLIDQFRRIALNKPIVVAIEDMHWLDPTSLELLDLLREEARGRRALIVITSRSVPSPEWSKRPGTQVREMARLSIGDTMALVKRALGAKADPGLERQIAERSDGMPLFAEELARSALSADPAAASAGAESIPASLYQSLAARFDRAGPARDVAQAGSVLGRSADAGLLAFVADLPPDAFEAHVGALVGAGIFDLDRTGGARRYAFKHALLRDAAYGGLVRDRRRALHARAAAGLVAHHPEVANEQPETVAFHLTEAGALDEAAGYWLSAGRRGLARSALVESSAFLRSGVNALKSLPDTAANRERRLEFMALLGPALIALTGPGSSDTEDLYAEAIDLCARTPESPNHFAIFWGWWRIARDFREGKRRADALHVGARARADAGSLLQAHHCQWASHFCVGDLDACRGHIHDGLAIYSAGDYRAHATLYGNHDAKVCAHGNLALVHWLQCRPGAAMAEEGAAVAFSRELAHHGSVSHALEIALMHRYFRGDPADVHAHAEALMGFGRDKGFADSAGKGLIFQGWARALNGDADAGVAMLQDGLARQKDVGTMEDFPVYFCMVAEAMALAGRHEEALAQLTDGEGFLPRIGILSWMPEVLRWKGRLLRAVNRPDPTAAADAFHQAIAMARSQGAHALHLRAAVDLAHLRRDSGADEAGADLAALLASIDADEGEPLVLDARRLLADWRGAPNGEGSPLVPSR